VRYKIKPYINKIKINFGSNSSENKKTDFFIFLTISKLDQFLKTIQKAIAIIK
jgi:hypothetical protein